MANKFRLKDLPLLIKNDRRFMIGAIILLVIILWPIINPVQTKRPVKRSKFLEQQEGTGSTGQREAYEDLVGAFKSDLDNVKGEVVEIKRSVTEQGENFKEFESRTAEIFRKVLERVNEMGSSQAYIQEEDQVIPQELREAQLQKPTMPDESLDSFGDDGALPPPLPPAPAKLAFVGAGDSLRVKLLAGVNAPTDGTPYPVVFQAISDIYGPDSSTLPIGGARIVAAAQGSLTDSRALFRITSLNLRLPNGKRKVLSVDGWIVGEDGVRGMPGILIDPIGKAIGGAAFAGGVAGLGQGIAQRNVIVNTFGAGNTQEYLSGDVGTFAAGRGLQAGATEWSAIIRERMRELVPVVQVLSGREATAVFAKSISVPELYEALDDDDGIHTSSLD